jgi:hypothetical protein
MADIAVGEVAANHVSRLQTLRGSPQPEYGFVTGEHYTQPLSVIDQPPNCWLKMLAANQM